MSLYDFTNDKDTSFGPIPAGRYVVICDSAEEKTAQSGKGVYVKCKFRVLKGEYEGRIVFQNFTLVNDSVEAAQIGRGQIKSFLQKAKAKSLVMKNASDLIGLSATANVKIRAGENGYEDSNTISHFLETKVTAEDVMREGSPF